MLPFFIYTLSHNFSPVVTGFLSFFYVSCQTLSSLPKTVHTVHTVKTVHTVYTVQTVHTAHTVNTVQTLQNVHTVQTRKIYNDTVCCLIVWSWLPVSLLGQKLLSIYRPPSLCIASPLVSLHQKTLFLSRVSSIQYSILQSVYFHI